MTLPYMAYSIHKRNDNLSHIQQVRFIGRSLW